ncbi:MAG TPA: helix-turn-helix transcriptional regulator [Alphaproteobacteria bacterium]
MNLSHKEADLVFEIMRELASGHTSAELRLRVGSLLLRLFDAQYLASYVWDYDSRTFGQRIAINMDDANLANYERYFQFRDPITPTLQRRKWATCVSEIISRRRLERAEFFNDFLARDGLHYGINFYAYSGGRNIGDLRIWRSRRKEDFDRRDAEILDAVGAAFTQSLLNARLREAARSADLDVLARVERAGRRVGLTRRQKEVAVAVLLGGSDRAIADDLCISLPTVRSHIRALYQKFGVSSRMQFSRAVTS